MEGICKHNMTGFCKFGEQCRKHHIKEICSLMTVPKHLASRDTPEFFIMYGSCKFGEECAYKHIIFKGESDISELSAQIKCLKSTIKDMSQVSSEGTCGYTTWKHQCYKHDLIH